MIVVLGMAAGTASEVAMAIKAGKKIILLSQDDLTVQFFKKIGTYKISIASSTDETISIIKDFVGLNQIH